jgi:hypothetical protein
MKLRIKRYSNGTKELLISGVRVNLTQHNFRCLLSLTQDISTLCYLNIYIYICIHARTHTHNTYIYIHNHSLILIYLLTAVGLTPSGSSTVHIYTQTVHRTTQLTSLVGRISGIRTQSGQTKTNDELNA